MVDSEWLEKRFVTIDMAFDWEKLLERGLCIKKEKGGIHRIYLEPKKVEP